MNLFNGNANLFLGEPGGEMRKLGQVSNVTITFRAKVTAGIEDWDVEPTSVSGNAAVLYEPLETMAPREAMPYCCYVNTVIFYKRGIDGGYELSEDGRNFVEYDQIESRFRWDDLIEVDGVIWEKGSARVLWLDAGSHGAGWYKRHDLYRNSRRACEHNGEAWRWTVDWTFRMAALIWRGRYLTLHYDPKKGYPIQRTWGRDCRPDGYVEPGWAWLEVFIGYRRGNFRIRGYGLAWKNVDLYRAMRSDLRGVHIGPIAIKLLKPTTLF